MITVKIPLIGSFDIWRDHARRLCAGGVAPGEVDWQFELDGAALPELWGAAGNVAVCDLALKSASEVRVSRRFVELARQVVWHGDRQRFALLYVLLCRLQREKAVLSDASDPLVCEIENMAKGVRRDAHKMKAFVRFRDIGVTATGRRQFAAWFEPSHFVTEYVAPFFARRFADMDWIVATPHVNARFEDGALCLERATGRPQLGDDAAEALWKTYFSSIFNPARLKVKTMSSEMPKKYWHNLPEAALIPQMIATAQSRSAAMMEAAPSQPALLARRLSERDASKPVTSVAEHGEIETLEDLRRAVHDCGKCPLHACATQAVCGDGSPDAWLMLVGEQPGDREDLSGKPFVGPAGQLLDAIMGEAGVDRSACYVTNAVKHFKFEPRGKKRLHKRPDPGEVQHCKWWLDTELKLVKPGMIVALGATAALALTGNGKDILKRRGKTEEGPGGVPVLITIHPASILRIPDKRVAGERRAGLKRDLERAALSRSLSGSALAANGCL